MHFPGGGHRQPHWLVAAACLLVIAGCYAEMDWREVASRQGGFSVLLPARAQEASGPLSGVAGNPVMHLWSAKAANTLFGAGYVVTGHAGAELVAALRDGLVRNIGGRVVSERRIRAGSMDGMEFVAEGSAGDARVTLTARFLVSSGRVYQLAVVGPAGAVAPPDLEMFFESFRLRPTGA